MHARRNGSFCAPKLTNAELPEPRVSAGVCALAADQPPRSHCRRALQPEQHGADIAGVRRGRKVGFQCHRTTVSSATATARSSLRQRCGAATGIPCLASSVSASSGESQPPAGSRSSTPPIHAPPPRPGRRGAQARRGAVLGPDVPDAATTPGRRRSTSARAVCLPLAGPSGHGAARKASTTGASSAASVARPRWPPW